MPPVKVAIRLSMLLLDTGENQRFDTRELRGHVVVVVEESLVVIAHRALAVQIGESAGAGCTGLSAAGGVTFRRVDKTVLLDRTRGEEVIAIDVAVA